MTPPPKMTNFYLKFLYNCIEMQAASRLNVTCI